MASGLGQKWNRVDYNVWLYMKIGDDGITYFKYNNSCWQRERSLVDVSIERFYKCKHIDILKDKHSTHDYKYYRSVKGKLHDGWTFLQSCDDICDDIYDDIYDVFVDVLNEKERNKMQVCSMIINKSTKSYHYLGHDESPMGALALSSISYLMSKIKGK